MKSPSILVLLALMSTLSYSQADSAGVTRSGQLFNNSFKNEGSGFFDAKKQKKWITKPHIVIETENIVLTTIENEISDRESLECDALLKRDTASLKSIWLRDFTLDEQQNDVQVGKNPIPYYVVMNRVIKRFVISDGLVQTSGVEYSQRLKSDGKVGELQEKEFNHTWKRELFAWKLTSKN